MGFLGFIFPSAVPQPMKHDLTLDLTTLYGPRKPVLRQPKPPSVPIPAEIVMNILESAYLTDDLRSNDQFLNNCALVCKDWSFVAQKLLFRHVTLRTQTAYIAFQQAVDRSTPRGRMLGDAVVRMHVVLDHNQPYRLSQRSFARAVTLCPNLYELSISLYGEAAPGVDKLGSPDAARMQRSAPSFDERTLALLRSGPKIHALEFNNWSDNSLALSQLLKMWPSLTALNISGTLPQLPTASEPLAPFPCRLEELRMNFQTSPSVEFTQWLLHGSVGSLRVIDLAREPAPGLLDYLVSEHGNTLQSFALPTCGSHEAVASVRRCEGLRELRIESPWASPMLYKSLPRDLQHLAMGVDSDTPLQPVLKFIKESEALRAVTVQIWCGGETHPQLAAIKIACAMQGIDLRFTKDVPAFRAMTRGDPVPSTSYPRTRSLRNVHYMMSRTMCSH